MKAVASVISRVATILGAILLGLFAATQYVASGFDYHPELGAPWVEALGFPLYAPWKFIVWDLSYGEGNEAQFFTAWGIVLFLFLIGTVFALRKALSTSQTGNGSTTHGSAVWASESVLKKANLLSGSGVVLGMNSRGQYIRHDGPEHVKIVAPSRSGKGVGIVVPTLLSCPDSVIVYDPKSENWELTASYRSQFSNVLYFNPADPNSCHFNPLLEVRKGELEVRDVQNIADMIVDPDGHGMNDHWAKTGHSLLVGTILHVLYAERDKTLAGVADFLSDPKRDIENTLSAMMIAQHLEDKSTHPVVAATARDMLNKSENERSGVLSTAMSFLSLYRDPIVANNTSDSDFRIIDLVQAKKPVSLYIAVPPSDVDRLRRLTRLIINQICRRLTEELVPEKNNNRVLMLLDEFPTLGRLNFFETALGFLAGYGIKAMLISQGIPQIEKAYGVKNSIVDNCHIKVVFTPNTVETAETISKMLGQKTESYQQRNYAKGWLSPFPSHTVLANQETGRALLTVDEVMKFPKDESILFVTGEAPIRARKIKYYEDANFLSRIKPPPNLKRMGAYPFRLKPQKVDWNIVAEEIPIEKEKVKKLKAKAEFIGL